MALCTFEDLSDHEALGCGFPKGGISAIGILKVGHGITDFADEVEWQAAITANTAKIIKGIKCERPEPSPVEGENTTACGSETILDGFDNTVEWKDFNYDTIDKSLPVPAPATANNTFYKELNSSSFAGIVLYYCEQDEIEVILERSTFVARPVAPMSNKEKKYYAVTGKWSTLVSDDFHLLYNAPVGIFS